MLGAVRLDPFASRIESSGEEGGPSREQGGDDVEEHDCACDGEGIWKRGSKRYAPSVDPRAVDKTAFAPLQRTLFVKGEKGRASEYCVCICA